MAGVDQPDLPSSPGTYAIVLEISTVTIAVVGSLGSFALAPGRYAYVGSARGAGGLRSRVRRHLRPEKRLRWHIDALTKVFPVAHVTTFAGRKSMECAWVHRLCALPGAATPIAHFGAGDCRAGCPAHLVRLPDGLDDERLDTLLLEDQSA
jgi:Uri superfamily endonuclease